MLKLSRLPNGKPEIFASIQGEGITAGMPSVFIRLSLCNLRCVWCDTKYTWDWDHYDPKREIIGVDVPDVIRGIEQIGLRNVVITGGEPLLQQLELIPLVRILKSSGRRIEIETNGTLTPEELFAELVDQWNVSPKLANSGNEREKREVSASLEWFTAQPNAYFKFVIAGPQDLEEVRALADRYRIPVDRVLLMPEGRSFELLAQRSIWLVENCLKTGYRYTPRLHVLLWGDERGR